MRATLYLFRHGKVNNDQDHDSLAPAGEKFRDWLPCFFKERGTQLKAVYYDSSVKRCAATLAGVDCEKRTGYGPGPNNPHKTLNAVLGDITRGEHALCCRGDSIESGQLYHVENFELHTRFPCVNHGAKAKERMRSSYHIVYVFELMGRIWRQADKIPLSTPHES